MATRGKVNNAKPAERSRKEPAEPVATKRPAENAAVARQGSNKPQEAADLGTDREAALAQGASDLTRAVDAGVVADRMAFLSSVVTAAGVVDVAEGIELLAQAEDVGAISAVIGLMSNEDLDAALELARMAGELSAISDLADLLQMPVLSDVMDSRGRRLHEMAVELGAALRSHASPGKNHS